MCATVHVNFSDLASAQHFGRCLDELRHSDLEDNIIFFNIDPQEQVLSNGNRIVITQLYLGFDSSEVGIRGDSILNFLVDKFEMPSSFQVCYPDETNTVLGGCPEWKYLTLSLEQRSLITLDLIPFLRSCSSFDSMKLLESKCSSLLGVPEGQIIVSSCPEDFNSFKIICETGEQARSLVLEISKLAQRNDCSRLFYIEQIRGVITVHPKAFNLIIREGILKDFLNKLCPDPSCEVEDSACATSSGL
jgi:hypothetical protein